MSWAGSLPRRRCGEGGQGRDHTGCARKRSPKDSGRGWPAPCRVHAFFRGLPGLWACIDPECDAVDRGELPPDLGPIGKLYAQPQATRDCGCSGVRVLHVPPLRLGLRPGVHRESARPDFLWHEPGGAFHTTSGSIPELFPLDLPLEEPSAGQVEVAEIDLVTGRLRTDHPPKRSRVVFSPEVPSGRNRDQRRR